MGAPPPCGMERIIRRGCSNAAPGGVFFKVGHSKTLKIGNSGNVWNRPVPSKSLEGFAKERLFFPQSLGNDLPPLDTATLSSDVQEGYGSRRKDFRITTDRVIGPHDTVSIGVLAHPLD